MSVTSNSPWDEVENNVKSFQTGSPGEAGAKAIYEIKLAKLTVRNQKKLTLATWVLVIFTAVLAFVGGINIYMAWQTGKYAQAQMVGIKDLTRSIDGLSATYAEIYIKGRRIDSMPGLRQRFKSIRQNPDTFK